VELPATCQLCHCRLSALNQQLSAAKHEAAKAHGWRQRWEASRMELQDLTASNARAMQRRHDLVASYWPVMARLNLAEDVTAALKQQVEIGMQAAVLVMAMLHVHRLQACSADASRRLHTCFAMMSLGLVF
jgi:hypothetical protein